MRYILIIWLITTVFSLTVRADVVLESETAEKLHVGGSHKAAIPLLQAVISKYPGTFEAYQAQRHLMLAHYSLGDTAKARTAVTTFAGLKTPVGDQPPEEHIYDAADAFLSGKSSKTYMPSAMKRVNYIEAKYLYEYILENFLIKSDSFGLAVRLQLAKVYVALDRNLNEAAQIEALKDTAWLVTDRERADAFNQLAEWYRIKGNTVDANIYYDYTISTWPTEEYAMNARISKAILRADINDVNSIKTFIDTLIADNTGNPYLTHALTECIVAKYYNPAVRTDNAIKHRKTILVAKYIGQRVPVNPDLAKLYYVVARSHISLEEYQQAINIFTNIIAAYPNHKKISDVLFLTGQCYKNMWRVRDITKQEAKSQIRSLYQELVNNHPNSLASKAAQSWLNKN